MMKSQIDSVFDPGSPTPLPYVVVAGDSFDAIAKKVGSTIHALQITNPSVRTLHPKQADPLSKGHHEARHHRVAFVYDAQRRHSLQRR